MQWLLLFFIILLPKLFFTYDVWNKLLLKFINETDIHVLMIIDKNAIYCQKLKYSVFAKKCIMNLARAKILKWSIKIVIRHMIALSYFTKIVQWLRKITVKNPLYVLKWLYLPTRIPITISDSFQMKYWMNLNLESCQKYEASNLKVQF